MVVSIGRWALGGFSGFFVNYLLVCVLTIISSGDNRNLNHRYWEAI